MERKRTVDRIFLNNLPRKRLDYLTPVEACYGRSISFPIIFSDTDLPQTASNWTSNVNRFFNELYPSLVKFQKDRYEKNFKSDTGKIISSKIGQKVLFYKPTIIGQKFFSAFQGPVEVHCKLSFNSYLLRDKAAGNIYRRHLI